MKDYLYYVIVACTGTPKQVWAASPFQAALKAHSEYVHSALVNGHFYDYECAIQVSDDYDGKVNLQAFQFSYPKKV